MRNFLKIHWFGFIISIFAVFYLTVFLLVLFAPREDNLNRGFIPCTQQLAQGIFACEKSKIWCMSKAIVKNTWCDVSVVLDGFGAWVRGNQATPWANYLFEPELPEKNSGEADESLQQFYAENPDIVGDMEKLDQERQKLEKQWEADLQKQMSQKEVAAAELQAEIEALALEDGKQLELTE